MSASELQLRNALCADLGQLRGLLDRYLEELSQHRAHPVGATTSRDYRDLDAYFTNASRIPYLLELGPQTVGFAFVQTPESTQTGRFRLDEFFILASHRRRGLGCFAVDTLFRTHPGEWELQVMMANLGARAFWQRVVSSAAVRTWDEQRLEAPDGPRCEFRVRTTSA